MPLEIVPVVRVERGATDPVPRLTELSKSHGRVLLQDAGALSGSDVDVGLLQRAAKSAVVWADASPRIREDAMDVFISGAERTLIRWSRFAGTDDLADVLDLAEPGGVLLGLEFRDGTLVRNLNEDASVESLARLASDARAGVVAIAERYDRRVAERLYDLAPERWWFSPTTEADRADLTRLAFTGVIVP